MSFWSDISNARVVAVGRALCAAALVVGITAGCGGIEQAAGDEIQQAERAATAAKMRCYRQGQRMLVVERTALRTKPSGKARKIIAVPRRARVALHSRDRSVRVCAKKLRPAQKHWFISVVYANRFGWVKLEALEVLGFPIILPPRL